jgi:hypothetical protein
MFGPLLFMFLDTLFFLQMWNLCQDHNVSWRSFSRPHASILFSYWSYDVVHQFHPVHDRPIGTEFYPLFPIYTGLPGASSACHLLARCFAELFYDPEDGGDTFLRYVGYHSTHYTASYPRRRYSSVLCYFFLNFYYDLNMNDRSISFSSFETNSNIQFVLL